jgi:hypothetical protein
MSEQSLYRLTDYKMKKIRCPFFTTSYLFILLSTIAMNTYSQGETPIDLEKAKSQLQKDREKIFIEALQLSVSQAAVFHPIYVKFNNEKKKLDEELLSLFVNYATNYKHLDVKLMTAFIKQSEKYQQNEMGVRKKYYKLLNEAISIEIGSQFYEVDDFISTSLRINILSGLPFTGAITRQKDSQNTTSN